MNPPTTQVDDLQLIALPTAVNCAELFVRFTLTEWSLRALGDDASAVACELVRSAVRNADARQPNMITVRLRLRGDVLVVELQDDYAILMPKVPDGLVGYHTGVIPLRGRGALIWCEVRLPTGLAASGVPLPRRERRRSPAAAEIGDDEGPGMDPEVIERILLGLNREPNRHAE